MFNRWLDDWDERQVVEGLKSTLPLPFSFGSNCIFPYRPEYGKKDDFFKSIDTIDAQEFYNINESREVDFKYHDKWLTFSSDTVTELERNNTVWSKVTESGSREKALVLFHHWGASERFAILANFFAKRGITVVEMALPYHLERGLASQGDSNKFVSANVGQTVQSLQQAVLDGRRVVQFLESQGYDSISVLGISLGSWVAGFVAAHDTKVSKVSLFMTAGNVADVVWSGRTTEQIKDELEKNITLGELRRSWEIINMENCASGLARSDLELQIVLAKRDTVIRPEISQSFVESLKLANASPKISYLNCGHYSFGLPIFGLRAGLRLLRFLKV